MHASVSSVSEREFSMGDRMDSRVTGLTSNFFRSTRGLLSSTVYAWADFDPLPPALNLNRVSSTEFARTPSNLFKP